MYSNDCSVSSEISLSTVEVLLSEDGGQHISISDAFIQGKCPLDSLVLFYTTIWYSEVVIKNGKILLKWIVYPTKN